MDAFIGTILPWPIDFAPEGWLMCQGQTLPIPPYQALYALLGARYGGDGTSNFKLPDLRGRVIVGAGQSQSGSNYQLAAQGGLEQVGLSTAQIPAHGHPSSGIPAYNGDAGTGVAPGPTTVPARVYGGGRGVYIDSYSATANTTLLPGASTGDAGGGQSHENRQPYLVLNYIICVNGIFPPRP